MTTLGLVGGGSIVSNGGGGTGCSRFKQNAWKKEMCSNCYKTKDEHQERPRPSLPDLPLIPASQGILKGWNKDRKKKRKSVSFPSQESSVIGYGGECGSSEDEYDYGDEEEDIGYDKEDTSTGEEDNNDLEEEKILTKLTKSNTDFNSVLCNLSGSSKPAPQAPPTTKPRETVQITIQPFTSSLATSRKLHLNKLLQDNTPTITPSPILTEDPAKERRLSSGGDYEADSLDNSVVGSRVSIEEKDSSGQPPHHEPRKVSITRGTVLTKNHESVKNKLYIQNIINSKDKRSGFGLEKAHAPSKENDQPLLQVDLVAAKNMINVLSVVKDSGIVPTPMESREMAGEPDGKADSDGSEAGVVTPPPRASFLHAASKRQAPKPPVLQTCNSNNVNSETDSDQDILPSPPTPPPLPEPAQYKITFQTQPPNVESTPKIRINCELEPPVLSATRISLDYRSPVTSDTHAPIAPITSRRLSRDSTVVSSTICHDNHSDDTIINKESEDCHHLVEAPPISSASPLRISVPPDVIAVTTITSVGSVSPSSAPPSSPESAPSPFPGATSNRREPPPLPPPSPASSPEHKSKPPTPTPSPSPPEPLPRQKSSTFLDVEKKKTKMKETIKKLLRFGSKEEMEIEVHSPRPRPQIIHPLDLNKSAVQVLPSSNVMTTVKTPSPEPNATNAPVSAVGRPNKPPPPPRSESLNLMERLRTSNGNSPSPNGGKSNWNEGTNIYANLGEARSGITPVKPVRTGSMREICKVTVAPPQPTAVAVTQQVATQSENQDSLYEAIRSSSTPECDRTSLPYCYGSETESDTYSHALFSRERCIVRRGRGLPVVHQNDSDNMTALSDIALHTLRSLQRQMFERSKQQQFRENGNAERRLGDFTLCADTRTVIASGAVMISVERPNQMSLLCTAAGAGSSLVLPPSIPPRHAFQDALPRYAFPDMFQPVIGDVVMLDRVTSERLTDWCSGSEEETALVVLQALQIMDFLQLPGYQPDAFLVLTDKDNHPTLAYINNKNNAEGEFGWRSVIGVACEGWADGKLARAVMSAGGLEDALAMVSAWLWGPPASLPVAVLPVWLTMQRSALIASLVSSENSLSGLDSLHASFLAHPIDLDTLHVRSVALDSPSPM